MHLMVSTFWLACHAGGQVLVILFSPHNTTSYDVRQLKRLWVDGNFVVSHSSYASPCTFL